MDNMQSTLEQKKYKYIDRLELIAFVITVAFGVFYGVSSLFGGDGGWSGLGLAVAISLIPTSIWRFVLWLAVKKHWPAFPILITADFLLQFTPPIPYFESGLTHTVFFLGFIPIPFMGVVAFVATVILAGIAALYSWQIRIEESKKNIT